MTSHPSVQSGEAKCECGHHIDVHSSLAGCQYFACACNAFRETHHPASGEQTEKVSEEDDGCTDCIPHGVESEFPAGMNPHNERWCECGRGRDAKAAAESDEALDLLGLAATAFRTGFVPPSDWLPRAHNLLGLPESNQPLRVGVNRWPFVESPGEFADRLTVALNNFGGYVLGAVRNVLIENPPTLEPSSELLAARAEIAALQRHYENERDMSAVRNGEIANLTRDVRLLEIVCKQQSEDCREARAQLASQANTIRELGEQLGNSVPRSRYDACNADWLAEKSRADTIADNAASIIALRDARVAELERWQSAALSWLRADDSPSALALRRDAGDPMLSALPLDAARQGQS